MTTAQGKRLLALAHDRAIDLETDDRLDRIPFIENLIRALVREEKDITGRVVARRSTSVVVGLTGKWGSGKSSVLNLLAERLTKTDHIAVASLNPWLFKGRDELLAAFFNELRDALGRSPKEHAHKLVSAMDSYREALTTTGRVVALAANSGGAGGLGALASKGVEQASKAVPKETRNSGEPSPRRLFVKATGFSIPRTIMPLQRKPRHTS